MCSFKKDLNITQLLHTKSTVQMIINGIFTDKFEIHKGLKLEDYPLSAALYIQALNPLIKYICWSHFSRVEVTLMTTGTTPALPLAFGRFPASRAPFF